MRVGIYCRVSTDDKGQDLDTQLLPLQDFCRASGWAVFKVYQDQARAVDLVNRTAWQALLSDASRRKFDAVLIWRIDRAFRSVLEGASTLERLRGWGVGLRSLCEPFIDTTNSFGDFMFHVTVAWASLERAVISQRTKAGLERVKITGTKSGIPTGKRGKDKKKRVVRRRIGRALSGERT